MTVPVSVTSYSYAGDGVSTVFPFPTFFYQNTDIKVYFNSVLQVAGYVVTGAGVPGGGSVTIAVPPAIGVTVDIYRVTAIQQSTSYIDGATVFSVALEPSLDYLTRVAQDINRDIGVVRTQLTMLASSVSAAAASAAAALASQNAAAASAVTCATLLGTFQATYYGAGAADPGGVPITGALFFNTTSNTFKYYNGAAWAAVVPVSSVTAAQISDASANGRSMLTAANYAAMKTLLNIVAADITDSGSTGRSILQSATVSAVKSILSYAIGDISGWGTSVAAALAVAVNTALGFVRLDAAGKLPALDGSALTNIPGAAYTIKASDEARASTTLTNDGTFNGIALAAGKNYIIRLRYLVTVGTTAGAKIGLNFSAAPSSVLMTAICTGNGTGAYGGGTDQTTSTSGSISMLDNLATGDGVIDVELVITNAAAGTLSFQTARVAGAGTATFKAKSSMRVEVTP